MRTGHFFLIIIFFFACKSTYHIKERSNNQYILSDTSNTSIDSSVYRYLTPYREQLEKEMNGVLAESTSPLEKGLPESKLGNFVSDACLEQAKKAYHSQDSLPIDFCFFNSGGLRKALPSGPLTKGDVYQLMPFENTLVVVYCSGADVENLVNFIASKGGGPVGGIRFSIKDGKATDITIGYRPFDKIKKYKVLTSDYLANGGDSFYFLTDLMRDDLNLKVRDALINYLTEKGNLRVAIDVKTDGRITNVK